jgi:hypothetical protein
MCLFEWYTKIMRIVILEIWRGILTSVASFSLIAISTLTFANVQINPYRSISDPVGYYDVIRPSHALKEFNMIWIGEVSGDKHLDIKGAAYIVKTTYLEGTFIDFKGVIEGKRVSFTTVAIEGITYKFEGRFLRTRWHLAITPKPVLQGILKKFQGDKKIAEANVRFTNAFGGNT